MKKTGTLNAQLAHVLARMGHTDALVICDAGLPIPRSAEVVDLALAPGLPRFADVLRVVLKELEVERAVMAEEVAEQGRGTLEHARALLPEAPVAFVPHEAFKRLCADAVAFVRTGETTPYANVILYSGVTFA